ncbi:hypothetical protein DV737_g5708, partial [Chaetothyriales sp. CBS 132003]
MSDKEFGSNEDLSLPKATVQKIISEVLAQYAAITPAAHPSTTAGGGGGKDDREGGHQTFTRPARDLLISCSLEFLRMLSSEANDIAEKDNKKTISIEHLEKALSDLGFSHYIEPCRDVVSEFNETQKKRTGRAEKMRDFNGMADQGEEALMRMQQELLAQAGQGGD